MSLFETQRLTARQLTLQDLPELTAMLSDPEVMEYSIRGVCDEAATRKFIDWCLASYSSHGVGPWALVEKGTGDFVGFCGVGPELVDGVEEVNLGYRLARRFWYRGLATEAATGTLDYAFGHRAVESVIAIIEPGHTASLRVSEKVGFRSYTSLEFHGRPVRVYRMTAQSWHTLHNDSILGTGA